MPRVYASNSDPIDFCRKCMPSKDVAMYLFGMEFFGGGPDGRGDCFGYDSEHPEYDDTDYECHECGCDLTEYDEFNVWVNLCGW